MVLLRLFGEHHVAVLAARPIAHSPSALISATISLLIEPASTISTISTVFWSVTRRPPSNFDSMPILASIAPICGPPPCTTIGLTPDCFKQRDVAGKGLAELGIAHGVAAIFHDHGLVLVALHVGQGPGKQSSLHLGGGGDFRRIGRVPGLRKGRWRLSGNWRKPQTALLSQ